MGKIIKDDSSFIINRFFVWDQALLIKNSLFAPIWFEDTFIPHVVLNPIWICCQTQF